MEPTIKTGSIVIIKPESLYKIGDIITFGKDSKTEVPTTHRIVADKAEDGVIFYQTKGDANDSTDIVLVNKKDVIGKVVFSVSFIGYIIDFAKKPLGFILLVVLPAIYIGYGEVVKIVKEVKKIKNEKEKNKTAEENESKKS